MTSIRCLITDRSGYFTTRKDEISSGKSGLRESVRSKL
jgi:hypothetical protein